MKILHVNKFFDLHGGADIYLHQLMAEQSQRGHDVYVLSTQSPKNLPAVGASRFVPRMDMTRSEGALRDIQKATAFLWNTEAKRAMERAITEWKPDVVHLHNVYHHLSTSILAPIRRNRIPCVQTLHDYKLACPNYKMFTEGSACERCKGGKYFEAVTHRCLFPSTAGNFLAAVEMGMTKLTQSYEKTVKTFIAPSQFLADKMAAWGEPPSKFQVIPNPVEIPATPAPRDGGYLLVAGRLSLEKGIETVIRAAVLAPTIKIKIAGIGPEESRLQQLAQMLDAVNVEFVGFLRRDDLREVRRHAAGVIVSSVWYENAPLAVLEALADGLPVIATRMGGLPELVEDGVNGLLVDPSNPEQLAQAMQRLLEGRDCDPAAMSQKSRERAQAMYTWDTHMQALEAVYANAQHR